MWGDKKIAMCKHLLSLKTLHPIFLDTKGAIPLAQFKLCERYPV